MYSAQPTTFEEVLGRAERCVERRTKAMVEDAIVFARWILTDGVAMTQNLTAVQARCTALLEEVRALRAQVDACERERKVLLEDAERMAGIRK